eukprot:6360803-Lingulodinium_polyedra.AAC.1
MFETTLVHSGVCTVYTCDVNIESTNTHEAPQAESDEATSSGAASLKSVSEATMVQCGECTVDTCDVDTESTNMHEAPQTGRRVRFACQLNEYAD